MRRQIHSALDAYRVRRAITLILALVLGLGSFPVATLAAEAPGSIAGQVYLDPAVSGTPSGRPLANAEVTLSGEGKQARQRTKADGTFSFADLPPGRYTVAVVVTEEYRATTSPSLSVAVQSGKVAGGVSFGLAFKTSAASVPRVPSGSVQPPTAPAQPPGATVEVRGAQLAAPTPARPPASPSPPALVSQPATVPSNLTSSPTTVTASPAPVASPSAVVVPVASPAPLASPSPAASGATPTSGTRPASVLVSPEDILAGRGVHWRPGEGLQMPTQAVAPTPTGAVPTPTVALRPVVTSLEPLRRATVSQLRAWADENSIWLGVPFRTQLDGTPFAAVNCGPASLAMVLSAFGMDIDPAALRDYVNYLSGDYDPDHGTSLAVLARVASEAGLNTFGLYGSGGFRAWTIENVREHVRAGHPVITLVKYRSLPGNGRSLAEFDHYIVITGLHGDDLIYNDGAFTGDYGYNLLISPRDLERAWSFSSIPRHAVALGLGDSLRPLPIAPRSINADSVAIGPAEASGPLAMLPGPAAQWLRERMLAEVGTSRSTPSRPSVEAAPAPSDPAPEETPALPTDEDLPAKIEPSPAELEDSLQKISRDLDVLERLIRIVPDPAPVRAAPPPPVAPLGDDTAEPEASIEERPADETAGLIDSAVPAAVLSATLLFPLGAVVRRRIGDRPDRS